VDEIDDKFLRAFRRALREHKKDLGDRTCYNIMQAVSTFLLRNGIAAAKPILKEMSVPPSEVIPYSVDTTEPRKLIRWRPTPSSAIPEE
jgi:hypothetical protein